MDTNDKQTCHHVVSFRVSDQERRVLDRLASATGMNISEMLRGVIKKMGKSYGEVLSDCACDTPARAGESLSS
ncbi:MAG: hypothetical protein C0622_07725 [Desulfuromonas sp.]|nr:MAG: hypothetical protein C0622_07725 [Desulfuromonas sp.]